MMTRIMLRERGSIRIVIEAKTRFASSNHLVRRGIVLRTRSSGSICGQHVVSVTVASLCDCASIDVQQREASRPCQIQNPNPFQTPGAEMTRGQNDGKRDETKQESRP